MPESAAKRHLYPVPNLTGEASEGQDELPLVEVEQKKDPSSFVAFSSENRAQSFYNEAYARFNGQIYKVITEQDKEPDQEPPIELSRHVTLHKPTSGKRIFTIEIKPSSPEIDEWIRKKVAEKKYASK